MIFIGFGFLMSFIKTMSWTSLAFNWIVSIWALQWAILFVGFFHQAFGDHGFHKIEVSIESLIMGDFGAGAAMITFGVILGKCSLQQLLCLVWFEMIFYALNEAICVQVFNVTDAGGSILVHTFGAYFGIGASYFFQPGRAMHSKNLQSSYQSEMIAVIGSIFLWMFWPSFNGALSSGVAQQRIIVNTVLAIGSSCFGGACTARFLFGKLEMEILLNASLAGGVAIGSTCDLIAEPWAALTIGLFGGILSAVGFQKIQPWLAKNLGISDTCGVNSLHGMPGIFAAITSAIYIPTMEKHNFSTDYFTITSEGGTFKN
jgi:ammonium transporter Rh